jgi:hypothetical protein
MRGQFVISRVTTATSLRHDTPSVLDLPECISLSLLLFYMASTDAQTIYRTDYRLDLREIFDSQKQKENFLQCFQIGVEANTVSYAKGKAART